MTEIAETLDADAARERAMAARLLFVTSVRARQTYALAQETRKVVFKHDAR